MEEGYTHLVEDTDAPKHGAPVVLLGNLITRYKETQKKIAYLEDELKAAKESFNQVSQREIPELLIQNGLSQIQLSTGEKVTVKQEVSVSIKDMEEFAAFLAKTGNEDILKTSIQVGKLPQEILEKLRALMYDAFALEPQISYTCHPQTLKKFVKELCGIGSDAPGSIPLQDMPPCASVYTYFNTVIK